MSDEGRSSVTVTIAGEQYTIRAEASPEYTRRCAAEVDRAVRQITSQAGFLEPHRAIILAALALADQLLEARGAVESVRRDVSAGSRHLAERIRGHLAVRQPPSA